MRYYKKCPDCNGQGETTTYSPTFVFTSSCTCEGGFVDCTSEVEAMRELLEEVVSAEDAMSMGYGDILDIMTLLAGFQRKAKALLAKIADTESMKG